MKIYQIGGSVRDILLAKEPHDIDYVVVGSTPEEMISLGYKQVGNDFPVFLHPETGDEYALARMETKTGDKHTDFLFTFTPDVTLLDDVQRRDFTINALAIDEQGNIIDVVNGRKDLQDKVLRHVNDKYFPQDPLRVLRVARFAAQLGFNVHPSTIQVCKDMVAQGMLQHLTPERVSKELLRACESTTFYKFIEVLDEVNALQVILPQIAALKEVPEKLEYHPEGTTYNHLLLTLKQVHDKDNIALLNFSLLCHDLGKLCTKDVWPSHHNHDTFGIRIVEELCDDLKIPNKFKDSAKLVCKTHMKFYEYKKSSVKSHYDLIQEVTGFKTKNNWKLQLLLDSHECDLMGRAGEIAQTRIDTMNEVKQLVEKEFSILENKTVTDMPEETQLILNRHKGEMFGKIYREARISYLKQHLKENNNE